MNAKGPVFKYGDNIDTDVIIPARYLNTQSAAELASHCMEDIDKDFVKKVKDGDIMVAGVNFGCGSSREHAPIAIRACGVSCVIAPSFARIFYRNAINIGLPILECEEAADEINANDEVSVDFDTGIITDIQKELGGNARVVATGGMGRMMAEYCPLINEVDPSLTLEGLRLIYQHNKDAFRGKKLADNIGNIEVTEEG